MVAIDTTSAALPSASCDPPLKPNQPSHRMKVPSVASGRDEQSMGLTWPPGPNLPVRAPSRMAPASAAQPPTECTRVEPAKSEKPSSLSQPPPHCQEPVIGYKKPVSTALNSRKGQTRRRSASVPETIEAAVATKTIWKNQSDAAA